MTIWTPELKAKAAMTRAHNKRKKQERMEKRMAKQAEIVAEDSNIGQTNDELRSGQTDDGLPLEAPRPDAAVHSERVPEAVPFDWEKAPLIECITKQAELKREFDRITQILERRQNPTGMKWMCFTEEIRREKGAHVIPKAVLAGCNKGGEDGKWKFRDDGRFVVNDGIRTLKPAFACNSACFSFYQMSKGQLR
jgi:hypothetical protein